MKFSVSNFSLDTFVAGDSKLQQVVNECLYSCKKLVAGIHSWMALEIQEDDVSEYFTELATHVDTLCELLAAEHAACNDLVDIIEQLRISLETLLESEVADVATDKINESVKETLVTLTRCLKSKLTLNEKQKQPYTPPISGRTLNPNADFVKTENAGESEPHYRRSITNSLSLNSSRPFSQNPLRVVVENDRAEKLECLSSSAVTSSLMDSAFSNRFSPISPLTEQSLSSAGSTSSSKRRKSKKVAALRLFLEFNNNCKRVEYNLERSFESLIQFAKEKLKLPSGQYIIELKDPEAAVFYTPEYFSEIKDLCVVRFRLCSLQGTRINEKLEQVMHDIRMEIIEKLSIQSLDKSLKKETNSVLCELESVVKQLEIEYLVEKDYLMTQLQVMKSSIGAFLENQNIGISEQRKILAGQREDAMRQLDLEEKELVKLQIVIEGLKDDTVKRSCFPSKDIIQAVSKKLQATGSNIKNASCDLKSNKAEWKKLWESELQQIVKEQEFMDEKETKMETEIDEIKYLENTVASLIKISDLKVKRKPARKVKNDKVVDGDSHAIVLQEISLMTANSEARLEAIKNIERRKMLEKEIMAEEGNK